MLQFWNDCDQRIPVSFARARFDTADVAVALPKPRLLLEAFVIFLKLSSGIKRNESEELENMLNTLVAEEVSNGGIDCKEGQP